MTIKHTIYEHTFSPEQARSIRANTGGYNFRQAESAQTHVQELADAMKSGNWEWERANPIRLSDDWSRCSDGLHRLTACAVSGIPLRSLVLVGEEWRAGIESDRGKTRTLAQFLAAEEIKYASTKSSISKLHVARLYAHERNVGWKHASKVLVHDQELINLIKVREEEFDWACSRATVATNKGLNSTGYGVFLFEAQEIDRDLAAEFHADFIAPLDNETDPLGRLRVTALRQFGKTGERLKSEATLNAFVKCWDLRARGESLKVWKHPMWSEVRFPNGYEASDRYDELKAVGR